MKLLAICIPNYNRIEKLERLVREAARQIIEEGLTDWVQICIRDDYSSINPQDMIEVLKKEFTQVDIIFERDDQNRGMDYNFLHSVLMAESEYCWIIGNDDMPTDAGISRAVEILQLAKGIDILLTPFDNCDEAGVRGTIYPLRECEEHLYNTAIKEQYEELLCSVIHNSGLFGFLSNVIFRKEKWVNYEERFNDKLNTIFIQVYMNVQTLQDGAKFLYMPDKIIKNYADDETNENVERICKILFGLDGVLEYFFDGKIKENLKRVMVDAYISGTVWELPDENEYKQRVRKTVSPKNALYDKYFIPVAERKKIFEEKNVIIYGAGNYGRKVYEELQEYNVNILGVADTDIAKIGRAFGDTVIISTKAMIERCKREEVYVLVANHFGLEDMVGLLVENEVRHIGIIS